MAEQIRMSSTELAIRLLTGGESLKSREEAERLLAEIRQTTRAEVLREAETLVRGQAESLRSINVTNGDDFVYKSSARCLSLAADSIREMAAASSGPAAGDKQPEPQTRQCGHDDYHSGHPWADQPHIWCPGHTFEGGAR